MTIYWSRVEIVIYPVRNFFRHFSCGYNLNSKDLFLAPKLRPILAVKYYNFFEDLFDYLKLRENCFFFRNNTYHQYHDGVFFLKYFYASINR